MLNSLIIDIYYEPWSVLKKFERTSPVLYGRGFGISLQSALENKKINDLTKALYISMLTENDVVFPPSSNNESEEFIADQFAVATKIMTIEKIFLVKEILGDNLVPELNRIIYSF